MNTDGSLIETILFLHTEEDGKPKYWGDHLGVYWSSSNISLDNAPSLYPKIKKGKDLTVTIPWTVPEP